MDKICQNPRKKQKKSFFFFKLTFHVEALQQRCRKKVELSEMCFFFSAKCYRNSFDFFLTLIDMAGRRLESFSVSKKCFSFSLPWHVSTEMWPYSQPHFFSRVFFQFLLTLAFVRYLAKEMLEQVSKLANEKILTCFAF
jgi:hypothetical protein